MWAILFLLSCIIDSIGCSNFDEDHTIGYEDFQDGSYSYSDDDDDDYEDEYSDPVSTEPPRVRRYDRMTHTVPTPSRTIGLPEVKDALQMLMLGRNLTASNIKELDAGGYQFTYPIDTSFGVKVPTRNALLDESIEIPIEFTEITILARTMTTRDRPTRSREQLIAPTRVVFTERATDRRTVNAKPTGSDFIDIQHAMIPFDNKNMSAVLRSRDQQMEPPMIYFGEQPTRVVFTNNIRVKPTRSEFVDIEHATMNIFKDTPQVNTTDEPKIYSFTESTRDTQLTEETPGKIKQVFYYYEDSRSATDVYIDSTETDLLQTFPVPPVTRTKAKLFETVFLYEDDKPDDDIISRMDDNNADDEDNDGDTITGKWSYGMDPLEYLLSNNLRSDDVLRQSNNTDPTINPSVTTTILPNPTTINPNPTTINPNPTTINPNPTTINPNPTTINPNGTTTRKPRSNTTELPTPYPFDVEKFLELVANLTYDYYTNLTEELNATLIRLGAPTCPTPTTTTTTTTTTPVPDRQPDYSMMENRIMGKCYVCGLVDEGIPWNAHCSDAFAGDFIPLSPVDGRAKGYISKFRKYCRYDDVDHYVQNITTPRTIFGRWTGGCGVRWTDISGIYTQRTCRNRNHPTTGKHYASKRMSKLEMALANTDNGCIVSPAASLIPLSRGISLYARFHACVCTGSWCNVSWRLDSDVWMAYVIVGLLSVFR